MMLARFISRFRRRFPGPARTRPGRAADGLSGDARIAVAAALVALLLAGAPRRASAFVFTGGPVYDAGRGMELLQEIASLGSILGAARQWLNSITGLVGALGSLGSRAVGSLYPSEAGTADDQVSRVIDIAGQPAGSGDTASLLRSVAPGLLDDATGQSVLLAGTQPSFPDLDRAPDAATLSNPAAARSYTRTTFGVPYGADVDTDTKVRIGQRRDVEFFNAAYDGHGIGLSQTEAGTRTGNRVRNLGRALEGATTELDQREVVGFAALALLEEIVAVRALIAALLRIRAATALTRPQLIDRFPMPLR
jgi:hypothetical protein